MQLVNIRQFFDELSAANLIPHFTEVVVSLFTLGALFIPLELIFPARKNVKRSTKRYYLKLSSHERITSWLRPNRATVVNIFYWICTPLFTRTFTSVVMGIFLVLLMGAGLLDNSAQVLKGYGPVSAQPDWLQCLEILVISDFIDYWTHRWLHTSKLWKIHAIHHSPEEMNWISSSRMHPVNDLITRACQILPLALFGFSLHAISVILPYLFLYVIMLHSNVNWSFGPFKYLLVSPAYHQWHHSSEQEAIDKNFSGIFPIWDILFGTMHFPCHLPTRFGVTKEAPPENIIGQLIYPFKSYSASDAKPDR